MKPAPANDDTRPTQDEGSRAQHWRQVIMGLSIKQLSDLTGYSVTAIRCFEANANTSGELFGEAAWRRYRMACMGVLFIHQFGKAWIVAHLQSSWPVGDRDASEQR